MKYIITLSLLIGLTYSSVGQEPEYLLLIEKIDNRAEVLLGDSVIYNSGVIDYNPDLNLKFNLNSYDIASNKLTIRLYNGTEGAENRDQHWEIRYYIYKDDEVIEYEWQYEDDFKVGLVYNAIHYFE